MDTLLLLAALLTIVVGIAHSVLGEKYILIRLFKRPDLPQLFGSAEFTKNTLRFAWHLTTVAWWGLAALLVLLARDDVTAPGVACVIAYTSFASFAVAFIGSRGRHLAWLAFLAIGVVTLGAA